MFFLQQKPGQTGPFTRHYIQTTEFFLWCQASSGRQTGSLQMSTAQWEISDKKTNSTDKKSQIQDVKEKISSHEPKHETHIRMFSSFASL